MFKKTLILLRCSTFYSSYFNNVKPWYFFLSLSYRQILIPAHAYLGGQYSKDGVSFHFNM